MTAPDIEAALEVRDCLDCLTPRQREAVTLRADGYNSREVAELMGISRRAVFLLIARARKRMNDNNAVSG